MLNYSGIVFVCIVILIILAIFINPANTVQKKALKWATLIIVILFLLVMCEYLTGCFRRYTGDTKCPKPKIKKYRYL